MRTLIAVALLVLVAGCGGSATDKGGSEHQSAGQVASYVDCDEVTDRPNADLELFVTNAVNCTVGGRTVIINWFKSKAAFKSYRDAADSFGGAGVAYGSDWAVECHDDQRDCDDVVKAVGD